MNNRILIPIDGSEHALKAIEFAANMKKSDDSVLYVIHVFKDVNVNEQMLDYAKSEGIKDSPYVIQEGIIDSQIIRPAIDKANELGFNNVLSAIIHGDPVDEIIKFAEMKDIDIIMMGGHGMSAKKGLLFGSVSLKVCHGTNRTCVIVRKDILEGKKILVVDDEPDVLETLEDILSMCELKTALTFDQAKKLLDSEKFDMAIFDIMGVNGYDLLDIATQKDLIPIMLTAHALDHQNIIKSHTKGAAFYVPKEKMTEITTYLKDVLESKEKGSNPWSRWLDRLGSYFDLLLGPDWKDEEKSFWDDFSYRYRI